MNRSDLESAKSSRESCDATESALAWIHREGMADTVMAGLEAKKRRRRRRSIAGALAVATVLVVAGVIRFQPTVAENDPAIVPASVALITSSEMSLPDGSAVELKNDAELIPAYTADKRTVILLKGTAYFKVTKDQNRPFIVVAGQVGVRAVGTAFSVELAANSVDVLVTEGRVAVGPDEEVSEMDLGEHAPAMVSGGERVTVDSSAFGHAVSQSTVHAISAEMMADRMSWRIPRLEFSGTTLADVVMMFNRHNQQQLVLGDESLANLKLSGLLRANNIPALLSILRNQFQVEADDQSSDQIVLRAQS